MTSQRNIHNERGSIVISTMVIISIVLVIMSGVVTMKLTELSKQTVKVNEAYRYLNIMEEMGMMVARARQLGRAGGTCPSGTFPHTATVNFCLPSYNASGTMQSACITDTTQKDRSGNDIRYCLMPAASSGITTTQNRNDDRPDVEFNVVQVKVPSMIERAFFAMVSPLQSAHAGCSLNQNWNVPCTPNNDGAGRRQEDGNALASCSQVHP